MREAAPISPQKAPKQDPILKAELIAPLQSWLSSLRVWLLDTIATLLDLTGDGPISRAIARELRAYLRDAEREAKIALLGLAFTRLALKQAHAKHHPPPGYAFRRWRQSMLRFLTHATFGGAPRNLRTRIARLRDMLDHAEAWLARLVKRLRRGFTNICAALAAPPAPCALPLRAIAPALADSS